MRKWLKISLITLASLILLLVLLSLGLTWYIHANKARFLQQITDKVNDHINGTLTVGDMESSVLKNFPNVAIGLQHVEIKDSLWAMHKHSIVNVDYLFVRVNPLSLLGKHMDINEITLQDGTIYLFTDSLGYSNSDALKSTTESPKKQKSKDADIKKLTFQHIDFIIDNQQKHKLFNLAISQLTGKINVIDSIIHFTMKSEMLAKDFAFNSNKGSYLKNKTLELNLSVKFNKHTKVLEVPQQIIRIDKKPVKIAGTFNFSEKPPPFTLRVNVEQVLLKEAASWLSPNISTKLNTITLTKPLDAEAVLVGHMKYLDTPHVVVTWKTKANELVTNLGIWDKCNFEGRFNNEVLPGNGHTDENSAVSIFGLRADLEGIPLAADTIRVVNLKQPLLHGHFKSRFSMANLNDSTSGSPIYFKSGNADADLYYTGPLMKNDNTPSSLQGKVAIQNADFTYLPRSLSFHHANATLVFTGQDLLLQNISVQTEKSTLKMSGVVKNLLNLYFTTPDKIDISWIIQSPLVDLNEFTSFLAPRKEVTVTRKLQKARASRVSKQLDVVLAASNVSMQIMLDKVKYRRFEAQQVKAGVDLTKTDILLKQISLLHAGGNVQMSGNLHQQGNDNLFKVNSTIKNVNISQFFYAFDNFGLTSLTSKNLRGRVSAKVNLTGNVLDDGSLAKHSLFGSLNFDLKDGALLDFGPVADIGNFFFRRRRLDSITFENLNSTFQVEGNKIIIPPMRIASSAVNIDLQGVYGLDGGTDIKMDVPLRNPAKDSAITDKEEKRRRSRKGIILHFHAVSEKDGKVKMRLGRGD
ncbi:AsmA family protein [Chitinophaga silvatica]|uniref:AsmA family protein n=1 Tax=Chitinophaga silvatica TaxID=2282649 RepID=A0A3E1Y3F6_9BACT|nr:AsmA-like C-terminal region-containing protein [Chitinophaga silvatica]RFS19201.1 AsmA family protein [Chitinophaga silvatica]